MSVMRCPLCRKLAEARVIDVRRAESGSSDRRRRECAICCRRFTTYERVEVESVAVAESTGTSERVSFPNLYLLAIGVPPRVLGSPELKLEASRVLAELAMLRGAGAYFGRAPEGMRKAREP